MRLNAARRLQKIGWHHVVPRKTYFLGRDVLANGGDDPSPTPTPELGWVERQQAECGWGGLGVALVTESRIRQKLENLVLLFEFGFVVRGLVGGQ